MASAAALESNDSSLDIGAGTGRVAAAFLQLGDPVIALEPACAMAEALRAKTVSMPARVVSGEGERLPFRSSEFEAVVIARVLYLTAGWPAILREANRVLKPGGVYALSTEFRLAGPPPGIPGALLFDWKELSSYVLGAAPWEFVGPNGILDHPATDDPVLSFAKAAAEVDSHVREHGELVWDRLHWREYPHVRLQEGERVWTSVHLALRKPDR